MRTGKKGPNGPGVWHRGKEADEWTRGRGDDGSKKGGKNGLKGSKPDWYGDKDKGVESLEAEAKAKAIARKGNSKSETRYCYDCGDQGHTGVNCPYKWTNSIDEEEDQGSSWESELTMSAETNSNDFGPFCI